MTTNDLPANDTTLKALMNFIRECGTCAHFDAQPKDMKNLAAPRLGVCRGGPPIPILMPAPGGGVQIQGMYATVGEHDKPCGTYKLRTND